MKKIYESNKNYPFEVRDVGAPYGLDLAGEIISRHKTYAGALRSYSKIIRSVKFYGKNSRLVIIEKIYKPLI